MSWGNSDTAATVGNPLFPPSGSQTYRCTLEGAGVRFTDVEATTGDEAAQKAVAQYPMAKVSLVEPAPQRPKLTAKAA